MKKDYNNLIDNSKYQIFLFVSNAVMPFSIAKHPWFVVNNKGDISRWEIIVDKNNPNNFVRKDFCDPFLGSGVFTFKTTMYWKEKLIGYDTGDYNSFIKDMVNLILRSASEYPFKNIYRFRGPNSNTYVQWVLNQFPEFKYELPWNSFGKGYRVES
jgi:hypothetical protein